jgi:predicted kinase
MECILFIGIQATGKSTFYKERFYASHLRINLDMLGTRHREKRLVELCLETGIPFVMDNTHPSRLDRERIIAMAKAKGVPIKGYYFSSRVADALERNRQRIGKSRIPDIAILGTAGRLELPSPAEGFNELFYVSLTDNNFTVQEWKNEL